MKTEIIFYIHYIYMHTSLWMTVNRLILHSKYSFRKLHDLWYTNLNTVNVNSSYFDLAIYEFYKLIRILKYNFVIEYESGTASLTIMIYVFI